MAYEDVLSLDCDFAIKLGGVDKKTGKANPTTLEGYYLGFNTVPSAKSKTGFAKQHVFKTEKGNIGVWGTTNLDLRLSNAVIGRCSLVKFTGMQETKNNPMYMFSVQQDPDNSIAVHTMVAASSGVDSGTTEKSEGEEYANYSSDEDDGESDVGEELAALDEAPLARPAAPRRAASTPNASQQARVQAMLNGRGKAASRS